MNSAFATLLPENTLRRGVARGISATLNHLSSDYELARAMRRYLPRLANRNDSDLRGRRIVIFAPSFPWYDIASAVALALAARGAEVTVAWLPHLLPTPLPKAMAYAGAALRRLILKGCLPSTGPVRGLDLTTVPRIEARALQLGRLRRIAEIDTHYIARKEIIDIRPDGVDLPLHRFRMDRDTSAYAFARGLFAQEQFDSAIIPNGSIFEFGAFLLACQDAGVDSSTFEFWERNYSCVINLGRHTFDRFEEQAWRLTPKTINEGVRSRVAKSMATREGIEWKGFLLRYQTGSVQSESVLRKELNLDKRPVVLVLPNVPYDTAIFDTPGAFATMREWFVTTLRVLAARVDCQVVIRAHPAERALGASETAREILEATLDPLPSHFRLIDSNNPTNTYGLMQIAAVGLVHSSTTGLELALRRVPTLVATKIHYADKGFTFSVANEFELRARLDELLTRGLPLESTAVDLAWIYADMYMNLWPRPFSFRLDNPFWSAATSTMEAILTDQLPVDEQDTFTILAGGTRARALLDRNFAERDLRSSAEIHSDRPSA